MFKYDKKLIIEEMQKSITSFENDLKNVRVGRVSADFLDVVSIEVYGSRMNIKSVAKVDVLDNQTLSVSVFDTSMISEVEKSIRNSALGVNPIKDGTNIKVIFPKPNEETRNSLVKTVNAKAEEIKISIRNHRRHFKENIEKAEKDKLISKDDSKRYLDELQKITNEFNSKIEDISEKKNIEIMKVWWTIKIHQIIK